jgi:holliday junction DNA helicase RuvA
LPIDGLQEEMLSYLKGTVVGKESTGGPNDRLVLEVGGIGFDLVVSRRTLLTVGQPGDDVMVHTALSIRENDWTIFGFAHADERQMFNLIQTVTGVGPKLALALIGTFGPQELADAILASDHKLISQAPGVGAKLAQRLILELKSKVENWQEQRGISSTEGPARSSSQDEVREILNGLGYTPTEVSMALKSAADTGEGDVESLVRVSLKFLGSAR